MIRPAHHTDLPALRELFTRANDAPYELAGVVEEKCFGAGIAGAPSTRVFEVDGAIKGAAVTCGKWLRILAVDRDARRRGIGTALLGDESVIFAEPGNYFTPGVLASDEETKAFFRARGFIETQTTWNLEVDLDHLERRALSPSDSLDGLRARRSRSDEVLAFVEREFGRIWRFEAAKAFDTDPPTAFVDENLTGFSVHDVNNRGLGFFGPTGVEKSARGKGIGCRLLLASLADLRRLGYAKAVIPWTDALDFYRKCCGAKPAHQFVTMQKV
ncbi:MAG TPA: GNAT family N-acetyltransferase [Thermoanaerobaculia bacterium]|nr:GNAT family N-acetyltransferase [Thermoanaerobaculia bacterium]